MNRTRKREAGVARRRRPMALSGQAALGQEFEEARSIFELNDTDGDLGIHGLIDGDAWRSLGIEGPGERRS